MFTNGIERPSVPRIASGPERLVEEGGAPLPRVGGVRRVVRRTVVREEAVAGIRIDDDLHVLVGLLEQIAELGSVGRRRVLVLPSIEAEEGHLDVLDDV